MSAFVHLRLNGIKIILLRYVLVKKDDNTY